MIPVSTSDLIISLLALSYRSRDEVQSIRKTRDPIMSLREKLLDSGLADTDDIKVSNSSFYQCHHVFTHLAGTLHHCSINHEFLKR